MIQLLVGALSGASYLCNRTFKRISMDEKISIGQRIEHEVRKQMGVTEFAGRLGCQRNNVYDIFGRENIDLDLLMRISKILRHDFLQYFREKDLEYYDDEDAKKARAIEQFHKVVPELLREMCIDAAIVYPNIDGGIETPDHCLSDYRFTFTAGNAMKERWGDSQILTSEMKERGALSVEVCRLVVNDKSVMAFIREKFPLIPNYFINIPFGYMTKEQWKKTLQFALEVEAKCLQAYGGRYSFE